LRIPGGRFLDDEGCASLHAAALRVLAEVGVEVRAERALGLLEGAGADVSGTRVRMRAALIEEALVSVPRSFVLHGRAADGSLDLDVRLGATYFGNGTDCLNFLDPRTGERRRATLADVETTASVVERLPNIDFVMDGVLPEDVPLDKLDLAQFAAMVKNTRKPVVSSSANGGETLAVMCEMAGLAGRADSFACLAMSNPPLILDAVCASKAMTAAEMGIPLIVGPGHSMGATAPASIAGVLVLAHAECLAAMVLHQLAAPGAPFLYGTGAGALDMRTMADVWC
jgi:trimethylamine--corrinoid protein Co-methyltransferase